MVGICRQAMMVVVDRTGDNDDYFGNFPTERFTCTELTSVGWEKSSFTEKNRLIEF